MISRSRARADTFTDTRQQSLVHVQSSAGLYNAKHFKVYTCFKRWAYGLYKSGSHCSACCLPLEIKGQQTRISQACSWFVTHSPPIWITSRFPTRIRPKGPKGRSCRRVVQTYYTCHSSGSSRAGCNSNSVRPVQVKPKEHRAFTPTRKLSSSSK